jgi:DNA polymerase III subunit epsilon
MKRYSVCDTETGGLDAKINALCSVAVITLDENLNEIGKYYTLVKDDPSKTIEDQALAINGLNREEIARDGKPVDQVMVQLKELFQDTTLVFHNAAFDAAFLNARGMNIKESIDSMNLSWQVWPWPNKAKLAIVCERLGFSADGAHNSLVDALLTAKLLKEFSNKDRYKNLNALRPQPIDFNRWKR